MAHFIGGGVSALSVSTTGILPGVTVGAVSGGVEGFIIGMGNSLMESSDRERALESGGQGLMVSLSYRCVNGGLKVAEMLIDPVGKYGRENIKI